MPEGARGLYQHVAADAETKRFGDLATVGIGYVSGANDFFHFRPSEAAELALPQSLLQPTLRNSRYIRNGSVSRQLVQQWLRDDEPILLLNIPKGLKDIPNSVRCHLDSVEGKQVRLGYKCRHREPWYSVPDVHIPAFFLTYLSGRRVGLVRNDAGVTCTNALHYVRPREPGFVSYIANAWQHPFTELSCEVEGHPLGGGVLKLEPREASAVLLTTAHDLSATDIADGIGILRTWRHRIVEAV